MGSLEALFPARDRLQKRSSRWVTNLGLVVIDTLAIRILFPIIAIGAAFWANTHGWGLLNLISLPTWLAVLLAVIILDMMIYWQHVAFHKIPILWRLHKVHHADRDLDASSGLRFHPVEIVISMLYKMGVVILLGAPVLAVIIFEILLNACALFNHANVRLPNWLERPLRQVMVTPKAAPYSSLGYRAGDEYELRIFSYLVGQDFPVLYGQARRQTHPRSERISNGCPVGLWWSLIAPFKRN